MGERNMAIEFKNVMEEIVLLKVDEIMKTVDICQCEQCRLDIASIVLNRVPAKYVATTEGSIISKTDSLNKRFEIRLVTEIAKAIRVVRENPHHSKDKVDN